jgi:SAM-dependent methyltransferase
MLVEEARWLADRILSQDKSDLFPFLNLGSSTGDFREREQPHIQREIFGPLARRGGPVYHVDIKSAQGVDLVGDILDPDFVTRIRTTVVPRCVLVSNLLEHVLDPARVAESIVGLVPPGGLIVVSGPCSYPYHPDPIDNRFRPNVAEAHSLFPGTDLLEGGLIVSGTWRPWAHFNAGRLNVLLYFARLAVPFYRPKAWRRRMDSFPYVFRRASAHAVVLRRAAAPAPDA